MTKELAAALFAAQKELIELPLFKDSTNPHFGSRFLSLGGLMEQLLPVLHKHDLFLIQAPDALNLNNAPALSTCIILAETGETLWHTMPLVLGKNDPQGQGSAITYARRYALMSILGLVADEDDDGNAASPKQQKAIVDHPQSTLRVPEQSTFAPAGGNSGPPI